jgi:hypothetical protein
MAPILRQRTPVSAVSRAELMGIAIQIVLATSPSACTESACRHAVDVIANRQAMRASAFDVLRA